ncbi:Uncharacterised protein [Actinomyces bovis]|uniref:Uncharacterized protein n=1 Tax=Actinomyces bovis TaxID=1658 RepID=A0ABY1VQE3_9ACTO|nr:Uncharacterised protein [Actinomyces bovis]VEG53607.1 Uncharacterised protein [Actinomyces israelii]
MTSRLEPGQKLLAAVPIAADGSAWALALAGSLTLIAGEELRCWEWAQVDRASWAGEERCFTLHWLEPGQEPLLLVVPEEIQIGDKTAEVDPNPFARVLRERVDSVVVHRVSGTLSGGEPVSVSARRAADGSLFTTVSGVLVEDLSEADREVLAALERRLKDGVGLPTT